MTERKLTEKIKNTPWVKKKKNNFPRNPKKFTNDKLDHDPNLSLSIQNWNENSWRSSRSVKLKRLQKIFLSRASIINVSALLESNVIKKKTIIPGRDDDNNENVEDTKDMVGEENFRGANYPLFPGQSFTLDPRILSFPVRALRLTGPVWTNSGSGVCPSLPVETLAATSSSSSPPPAPG